MNKTEYLSMWIDGEKVTGFVDDGEIVYTSAETESIQNYVGDEDSFSVGRTWIPNQYYKCPETGLEMVFTYRLGSGWGVGAPEGMSSLPILTYFRTTGCKIPFPSTPLKYAVQEKEFYEMIKGIRV